VDSLQTVDEEMLGLLLSWFSIAVISKEYATEKSKFVYKGNF